MGHLLGKKAEEPKRVAKLSKKVPSVAEQVGRAVSHFGNYYDLTNKEQVVAIVDDELCINCGRCYQTCNDSAYQAIEFDCDTHLPLVTNECTGCGLCATVCPVVNCITFVPKQIPHIPNRGVGAIEWIDKAY